MRNIASCYSEHAVKVSDSYCSAIPLNKSYVSPKTSSSPSIQNAVIRSYKIKVSLQKRLIITLTWSNKLICQGFWIKISDKIPSLPDTKTPTTARPPHQQQQLQLNKIKGTKSFDSCKSKVQVFWDLSNAQFESLNPQPESRYYIVVLIDSQVGLLLGDMEFDPAVKAITVGLPISKSSWVSQCEHFSGSLNSSVFSTKAKFCDSGSDHDIEVKFGVEEDGPRNPILSVSVDKKKVVRVRRLRWNFRGNQVIFIDGLLVDVMWDFHGWIFNEKGCSSDGFGVVMLRTRSGLDSRLWLEEQTLAERLNRDKVEFSFMICASKK